MKPVWTSHRGLSHYADENSLESFEQARDAGFESFETDLRLTADGHIVLCHDPSFFRLGGPDKPVDRMSRNEIASITLRQGSSPLFFDQFIDRFAGFSWIFDIKSETASEVISALAAWLQELGSDAWFLSHSRFLVWTKKSASDLRRLIPRAELLAMEPECWRAGVASLLRLPFGSGIEKGKTYSLPPTVAGISLFETRKLDYFHSRGAKVIAYLPESEADARRAADLGFDEILTNHRMVE